MSRREADWLPVDEARARILEALAPMPSEDVALDDAAGAVLAETVHSTVDLPPWDNSAMDGFAARADDVRGASPDAPVSLRVVDDVPAGQRPARPLAPGEAARVMTGAPVPAGADSVIRIEHTDLWPARPAPGAGAPRPLADDADSLSPPYTVRILSDEDATRNIRRRGENLARGELVLEAGRLIGAPEVGALAAVGRARVPVHGRPVVAILSNGDELVEPEQIDAVAAGAGIVDSNSHALAAALAGMGARPRRLGIARDREASLRAHVERALDADALITTAGASVGDRDLVKDVLDDLGFELAFWRVKMRPGSPFSFGFLPRAGGAAPLPVFGLPGNPVSSLVTFEVLVRPALRHMLGLRLVHTPTVAVRAAERIPSRAGRTHFLRARLVRQDGEWHARLTGPQGSGILRSMLEADGLVIVPETADGLERGAMARAILLRPADAVAAPEF